MRIVLTLAIFNLLFLSVCYGQPLKTAQSDDCGIIEESPDDVRTKVPWVAAIFARTSSKQKFAYRITGTIIGPTTILTIFAGAYGEPIIKGGKYFLSPPFNYKVAVGLKSNSLDDLDGHSQVAEVKYIVPFTGHESDNQDYHFFIFHLKTPLNLKTPYARAACVPLLAKFFGSSVLEKVQEIHQGGFSVPTLPGVANPLHAIKLSLGSPSFCSETYKKFYTSSPENVYCANVTADTKKLSCTLHGSAPVVPLINNKWFIIGITALIPPPKSTGDWCNPNTVYFYGKLLKAIDWIENNLKCGPTEYACADGECLALDRLCNKVSDCTGSEDEDPIYCRARRPCIYDGKSHECGVYGECIRPDQVCDGQENCADGSDENPSTCGVVNSGPKVDPANRINIKGGSGSHTNTSAPKCPLLQKSEGVKIVCNHPTTDNILDCSKAEVGTVAIFRCQNYYKSVYRLPSTVTKCTEDGTWKPQRPFGCEPECGIISNNEETGLIPFVIAGQETTKTDAFPWHTAIFYRRKDSFVFICGGSLIEKSVIVTAAHCVTDPSGVIWSKQNFKVALGAISSSFEANQNNPNVQIFSAINLWVPSTYDRRNLQSDIALIQLDKSVSYGEYVRPVCYFSQGGHALPRPGDVGKVSGLGFVNDTSVADHLMYASFPVIPTQECATALKRIPPLSTFCAGYQNGTAVCQGDSGGGMVFPDQSGSSPGTTRYVLKGIVSHGEVIPGKLCNPNNYAVFTHVDAYADWILQRLEGTLTK